jgi:hypothetical protein
MRVPVVSIAVAEQELNAALDAGIECGAWQIGRAARR